METTIKVNGMHCRSCELLLMDVIGEIPGVETVSVNRTAGTVSVRVKDGNALENVRKAIEKEGYRVV